MRMKFLTAAAVILPLGLAAPAAAKTVVATTADAGGTVSVTKGDTLVVKLPGHWKAAGGTAPELTLDRASFHGHGARGRTVLTFDAASHGSVRLGVKNAITGAELSMRVDVAHAR